MLRQELMQLKSKMESSASSQANTHYPADESEKVDRTISRYLPAIQMAVADTLSRAMSDLKNDLKTD